MSQEERTHVSHVRMHVIRLIGSLNTLVISIYVPGNYPNTAWMSSRKTWICDDPDIDHTATGLLSQVIHNHPILYLLHTKSKFEICIYSQTVLRRVPPELNESLRPRQAHNPISANSHHPTYNWHLLEFTSIDCDGYIFIKQALDHCVPWDCMHFEYAVKLFWRYTGNSLRQVHNLQIRIP